MTEALYKNISPRNPGFWYYTNVYDAQTFAVTITPTVYDVKVSIIRVYLARMRTPGGNYTVVMYNAGEPNIYGKRGPIGAILATASIECDSVEPSYDMTASGFDQDGAWHTLTLNNEVTIKAGTYYDLVFTTSYVPGLYITMEFVATAWNRFQPVEETYLVCGDMIYYHISTGNWMSLGASAPLIEIYGDVLIPSNPLEPSDTIDFPPTRPDDYDDDLHWVPGEWDGDEYTPPHWDEIPGNYVAAGGGRFNQNLVVAGNNKIYYEDYE